MPAFAYQALDSSGKTQRGVLQGDTARAVRASLRARGLEGSSLAAGLAEAPETFPEIYLASIAAGEQSGRLDQVLARLADYTEARDALKQKVWAALAYPILLTIVAVAVVTGLLVYVVPQIVGVFTQMHQALPWPTRALLALSAFVKVWGWLLLIFIVVAA